MSYVKMRRQKTVWASLPKPAKHVFKFWKFPLKSIYLPINFIRQELSMVVIRKSLEGLPCDPYLKDPNPKLRQKLQQINPCQLIYFYIVNFAES
jgi:hypothetical protein